MNTLVNEKVINSLLNDDNFNNELKAMLNAMIDEELSKEPENMNCDLIDECVQMLIDIEQESDKGFAVFVPLLKSKAIISACEKSGFRHLGRGVRAAIVAAIILLSAMTANAAVDKIFDYNIAHEVVSTISEKLKDWGIIASADDKNEIIVDKIPATTTPKEEKADESTTEPAAQKETPTDLQAENINQTNNSQMNIEKAVIEAANEEATAQPPLEETKDTATRKYTLTLDADGGKCDVSSVEVEYGKPIGELPTPTREGYDFGGWYNKDISYELFSGRKEEIPLKSNTVYNLEKDATVTAKWYKIYTVIFDANGGQCDIESMQYSALTGEVNLPIPTREGYIFREWRDADGFPIPNTYNLYRHGLLEGETLVLTARWLAKGQIYTVAFDANGGSCDVKKKDVIIGQPYGELPTPKRDGFIFAGWFVSSDINSEQITEDSIALPYDKLFAVWYKTTATVTFDANGGECDVKSKIVYSHNLYGELPTPTRTGYKFAAWCYNDTAIFWFSDVGDEAIDHTLTAIWIPNDVPVYFNANGGRMSSNNDFTLMQTYGYMTEYGSFPDATRTGYKLVGWFTEREGGTKVEETDLVNSLDGIVLYAHWEKDENICTVTFYSHRDYVSAITYNKGDKLGNVKPTVDGGFIYDFAGWYTDKYYGEKVDNNFEITGDIDLYAHWIFKPSTFVVTLELEKTEYELNEEIDIRTITMIKGYSSYVIETITGEKLAEAGAIIEYDTSTYGEHTLTVTMAQDKEYMVTMVASATIVVKGCEHNKGTYIVNQVEPTCIKEGYTGDTLCNGCNEILEKGTIIKATGHDENTVTEIINKKDATCTEDGYTGDTVCTVCGEVLQKGETISKISHVTEDVITKATFSQNGEIARVCTMCGQQISSTTIFKATASLSAYFYTYDRKMKTPTVFVNPSYGSEKIDYTVTMDEGRTDPGIYKVYITISNDYYEDETVLSFIIELTAPSLRLTATADGFIASWDKINGVDGYEIMFESLTYGSASTITVSGSDSNSLTVENLSEGVYYVYVRAIKNGVASPWSTYQKVVVG